MRSIQKARAIGRKNDSRTPRLFSPPYGGGAYYGQAYHWEQILHYRYWAYIAIRAWMNEIAGGDPPQFGDLVPSQSKQKRVRKALGGPGEHEEFRPYSNDDPVVRVFKNPNGPDVAYDLWAWHILFKKLTGESHWWVVRNSYDVPVEIWVIPTHWMRLTNDKDGQPAEWVVQSPWGQSKNIPYDQVVNFYEHSPLNRYEGYGATLANAEWVDSYESLTRMRLAVWKNGAIPALHVALGEAYMDPDDQFLNRFYSKWFAKFQGENNSGLPLITGADVEVKGIDGHRPAEALQASNDSEEHIRDMVLSAFGVNKGIVGLEPISDTSAYAPQRAFCRFHVNPELAYAGQVITEKIVRTTPGHENGLCFFHDRVANDTELEERQLNSDVASGVRTLNEARAVRGLQPYPHGGDDPIVGGQVMPYVTGKQEEDSEFAGAYKRAMSEGSSSTGGYLVPSRNGRH